MKHILILLIVFCNIACKAQIYEELQGYWIPEEYALIVMMNDEQMIDSSLFPVESFQIDRTFAVKFVKEYNSDLESKDTSTVDNFILIKTYKSEYNGYQIESVNHEGKHKYKIVYFYEGLNMKYVKREIVEHYKKSNIYISKNGNRLLLEIIGEGSRQKLYFINGINNYKFKNFDDAKSNLKKVQAKNTDNQEYSGNGSLTKELNLTGKETFLSVKYEFYKEPDELLIYDQNRKEIFRTGMRITTKSETETIEISNVTKLIFKVKSKELKSKWNFSILLK